MSATCLCSNAECVTDRRNEVRIDLVEALYRDGIWTEGHEDDLPLDALVPVVERLVSEARRAEV